MRIPLAFLALLAASPPSPADPVENFRSRIREAQGREATFFEAFQGRFSSGLVVFDEPWQKAHYDPKYPQDATRDFKPFHDLYGDFVAIEESRAGAAEALVASGSDRAAPLLFEELLDLARRADGADAAMEKPMPPQGFFMCDQRPGVLRHGLGRLERRLLPALAKAPGAAELLCEEGWKRACDLDGRTSVLRRVAVVDALGLVRGDRAREFLRKRLESKSAVIRIAAAEALLRCGPEAVPALLPLLKDANPVVLTAVLQGIRAAERRDPRWIRPAFAALANAKGRLRDEVAAVLERLTGQPFGGDADRWKEWITRNAEAIDAGAFDAAKAPVEKAGTTVPDEDPVFYGTRVRSLAPILLLDGSFVLHTPVEVAIAATRHRARWPMRPKGHWDDPPPIHHGLLVREVDRVLGGLLPGSTFGLLGLVGKLEAVPLAEEKMLKPMPAVLADAREFVTDRLDVNGYCSPYEGLKEAARLARLDPSPAAEDFPAPRADTVLLVHTGLPSGGRFVGAEPVVEACARLLRFRRLLVHAIRIGNEKEEGENTMKGIAEATAGTYRWIQNP